MNFSGADEAVFSPVGFGDEHTAADCTAFQVRIPENLCFQCPVQRQDRPAKPLAADRERNRLRTGAGVPIAKGNAVAVLTETALPANQGICPFPLPFFLKRLPAPFLWCALALALRDILSRSPSPCGAYPAGVFLFGRSFCFQGAVHR